MPFWLSSSCETGSDQTHALQVFARCSRRPPARCSPRPQLSPTATLLGRRSPRLPRRRGDAAGGAGCGSRGERGPAFVIHNLSSATPVLVPLLPQATIPRLQQSVQSPLARVPKRQWTRQRRPCSGSARHEPAINQGIAWSGSDTRSGAPTGQCAAAPAQSGARSDRRRHPQATGVVRGSRPGWRCGSRWREGTAGRPGSGERRTMRANGRNERDLIRSHGMRTAKREKQTVYVPLRGKS